MSWQFEFEWNNEWMNKVISLYLCSSSRVTKPYNWAEAIKHWSHRWHTQHSVTRCLSTFSVWKFVLHIFEILFSIPSPRTLLVIIKNNAKSKSLQSTTSIFHVVPIKNSGEWECPSVHRQLRVYPDGSTLSVHPSLVIFFTGHTDWLYLRRFYTNSKYVSPLDIFLPISAEPQKYKRYKNKLLTLFVHSSISPFALHLASMHNSVSTQK